jgi:hypothetical protein
MSAMPIAADTMNAERHFLSTQTSSFACEGAHGRVIPLRRTDGELPCAEDSGMTDG